MRIGPYSFANPLALAPMAGVTDRPFRQLCRRLGAGLAASEMITADSRLWHTRKSRLRMDHRGEAAPRIVQIAGGDAEMMAEAARLNVERGAQIIDINMGCPAKKVCRKAAGSALLANEALVGEILRTTVAAVDVPVTLKIRTGPCPEQRNAQRIARIAEDAGIAAIAIHGRSRADAFQGQAEYDTIAAVVDAVDLPVLANGDIDTPAKAAAVLRHTGAAGLMIGRAAQGRPWVFREIAHYLSTGQELPPPSAVEIAAIAQEHLLALHAFYGEQQGVRVARKHIGWYARNVADQPRLHAHLMNCESASEQIGLFDALMNDSPISQAA